MAYAITTKSTQRANGARMNESASAGPSEWARKLLEKQGWKECVLQVARVARP